MYGCEPPWKVLVSPQSAIWGFGIVHDIKHDVKSKLDLVPLLTGERGEITMFCVLG